MFSAVKKDSRGVTLVEMLTVVSIIGVLGTIGNASYSEVRRLGRDVRRFGDVKQTQTALELYFASHNSYPGDGVPGPDGIILGEGGATALDDSHGWTSKPEGIIYTRIALGNPAPNGMPYLYRSLDAAGNDCDANCASYEIQFISEGPMAGFDPGLHAVSPFGILAPEGVRNLARPSTGVILREGVAVISRQTVSKAAELSKEARNIADRPEIQAASSVAAPASVALPLAGAAAAGSMFMLPQYLIFFFSQPFLLLFRRKRKSWGVVYNSLTKLPVDLAIVRLVNEKNKKIFASTVTDKSGRFTFVAPPGQYSLDIVKASLRFPSEVMTGARIDGAYTDLYFGEIFEVAAEAAPHPNVPLDPLEEDLSAEKARRRNFLFGLQRAAALSGPVMAAGSFAIKPEPLYAAILALHILIYLFFRRLHALGRTKGAGAVYDETTGEALPRAILRLYALPYHKLVETKISDGSGRYSFLIGPGEFYMTVERAGYIKTETDPIKVENQQGTTINAAIPMRRVE